MDYSKVDWSRCKLPETDGKHEVDCYFEHARILLRKKQVAIKPPPGCSESWMFFADALSREEVSWALKAADAVDAFLVEEEKRVELENQPWLTPRELLVVLLQTDKPVDVKTRQGNALTFELRGSILSQWPTNRQRFFSHVPIGEFLSSRFEHGHKENYRIIPQSQPDTSVVEKKWTKSLVVTGEHSLIAVRSAVSPATLEVSNTIQNPVTSCSSDFPGPGQRVRLTLEVEE